METIAFIRELIEGLDKDPWEPTDTGFQLGTHNYIVKLRRMPESVVEMTVETYSGDELIRTSQKRGPEAADDDITGKLAYLYQEVSTRPVQRVAQLDDVVREIRGQR